MNFKAATDALFGGISHERLAKTLGVSIATIRQARLRPDARAHRSPPEDWEHGVAQLAEEQIAAYRHLIDAIHRRHDHENRAV